MATILSMLPVGKSEALPETLQELFPPSQYKRFGVRQDGNCLFHTFLMATDPKYQALEDTSLMRSYATKHRKAFAKDVETYLKTVDDPSFFKPEWAPFLHDIKATFTDKYPMEKFLEELANTKEWLGDQTWALLELVHNVHIVMFFKDATSQQYTILCRSTNFVNLSHDKMVFILNVEGMHYEPIMRVKEKSGKISGVYSITDKVAQRVIAQGKAQCMKDDDEETKEDEATTNDDTEDEAKAKAEDEAKAKAEDEAKAKAEDEADAKAEDEADAKAEAEADAKAEDEAEAKAEAEAKTIPALPRKNVQPPITDIESFIETILMDSEVVFLDDDLQSIFVRKEKGGDFIQYTQEQIVSYIAELSVSKRKALFAKRRIATLSHLFTNTHMSSAAVADEEWLPIHKPSLTSSMLQPVVHSHMEKDSLVKQLPTLEEEEGQEDNKEPPQWLQFLRRRNNIVNSRGDDFVKQQRRLQDLYGSTVVNAPEGTAGTGFQFPKDISVFDAESKRPIRLMGELKVGHGPMVLYDGDTLDVHGFLHVPDMRTPPPTQQIDIAAYEQAVAEMKAGDVVDLYMNDFLAATDGSWIADVKGATLLEATPTYLKIDLTSAHTQILLGQGKTTHVLYYNKDKPTLFYVYPAGQEEGVFHKSLLRTHTLQFGLHPKGIDATCTFVLPTLSQLIYTYKDDVAACRNLLEVEAWLDRKGFPLDSIRIHDFAKLKVLLEEANAQDVAAHKGKPAHYDKVLLVPPGGPSAYMDLFMVRNRKMLQSLYHMSWNEAELKALHGDVMLFQRLCEQRDKGLTYFLHLYEQYVESQVSLWENNEALAKDKAAAEKLLQASVEAMKGIQKECPSCKVTVKDLEVVKEYRFIGDLIEDQGKLSEEWEGKYALLHVPASDAAAEVKKRHPYKRTALYKHMHDSWVFLGCLEEDGATFNMVPLYTLFYNAFDGSALDIDSWLPYKETLQHASTAERQRTILEAIEGMASLASGLRTLVAHRKRSTAYLKSAEVPIETYPVRTFSKERAEKPVGSDATGVYEELELEQEAEAAINSYAVLQPQQQEKDADDDEGGDGDDGAQDQVYVSKVAQVLQDMAGVLHVQVSSKDMRKVAVHFPLFEDMLLNEKIRATQKALEAKKKKLDKAAVRKLIFKTPADELEYNDQNRILIAGAFMVIFLQLHKKTQDAASVIEEVAAAMSVEHAASYEAFADVDKLATKVRKLYGYILQERPAYAAMLEKRLMGAGKSEAAARHVYESSWQGFRPPVHSNNSSSNDSNDSRGASKLIQSLYKETRAQKPLKINALKKPLVTNSCCLEPLSGYMYIKNKAVATSKNKQRVNSALVTKPRSALTQKPFETTPNVFSTMNIRLPRDRVQAVVSEESLESNYKVHDAWKAWLQSGNRPLLANDAWLSKVAAADGGGSDKTWYAFSSAVQGLFEHIADMVPEWAETRVPKWAKDLLDKYILFEDVEDDAIPRLHGCLYQFMRNDLRRIVGRCLFEADGVVSGGSRKLRSWEKRKQEDADALNKAWANDALLPFLTIVRKHPVFQTPRVQEAVAAVLEGMVKDVCTFHVFHDNATYMHTYTVYVGMYIFLKAITGVVYSLSFPEADAAAVTEALNAEGERSVDAMWTAIHDRYAVTKDRSGFRLVADMVGLIMERLLGATQVSLQADQEWKAKMEAFREQKKQDKIQILTRMTDDDRDAVKLLEDLGLFSLDKYKQQEEYNEDKEEQQWVLDKPEMQKGLDKGQQEEEENYSMTQIRGENDDDMNDDYVNDD